MCCFCTVLQHMLTNATHIHAFPHAYTLSTRTRTGCATLQSHGCGRCCTAAVLLLACHTCCLCYLLCWRPTTTQIRYVLFLRNVPVFVAGVCIRVAYDQPFSSPHAQDIVENARGCLGYIAQAPFTSTQVGQALSVVSQAVTDGSWRVRRATIAFVQYVLHGVYTRHVLLIVNVSCLCCGVRCS